jgi:hypothetical protein
LLAHVGPDFQCGFNRNARSNLEKPCSVLLAAVAIPTAVAIPKAAKIISRFMTVLPQSAATKRSRRFSGMSPVIELVSFVSEARDAGLVACLLRKTAVSWDIRENRKIRRRVVSS